MKEPFCFVERLPGVQSSTGPLSVPWDGVLCLSCGLGSQTGKAEQPALEASASVLEETPSTPEDEPMLVEGEPHPAAEPALLGGAERPADGSDAGAAAAAGEGTSAAGTADAQTAGALAEASEAQQPGEAAAATAEAAVAESGKVEQEEEAGAVEAEGPEEVQKTPSRTPSPAKKPPLSKRKRDSDPVPASNNTSRSKAQVEPLLHAGCLSQLLPVVEEAVRICRKELLNMCEVQCSADSV